MINLCCKKHPAYKALREPRTAACLACYVLYRLRQSIEQGSGGILSLRDLNDVLIQNALRVKN